MVNTKNKGSPISAITTHYKYTRKRRLSPIRLLGSPQATIHYGEVYAYKVSTHPICIGSFIARFNFDIAHEVGIRMEVYRWNAIEIYGNFKQNTPYKVLINDKDYAFYSTYTNHKREFF